MLHTTYIVIYTKSKWVHSAWHNLVEAKKAASATCDVYIEHFAGDVYLCCWRRGEDGQFYAELA